MRAAMPQAASSANVKDKQKERLQWFHTTLLMLLWQVATMTPLPYLFECDTLASVVKVTDRCVP